MKTIKEVLKIGYGPSSSHTMGPANACDYILNKYPTLSYVKVTLLGSLAMTGKGHLTDVIIDKKLKGIKHDIVFDTNSSCEHPNTLHFEGKFGNLTFFEKVVSIGGGNIVSKDSINNSLPEIYPHNSLEDILKYCKENNLLLADYILKFEDKDIREYIGSCYDAIEKAKTRGISAEGKLPGKLGVDRKARQMYLNMRNEVKGNKNILMNVAISSFAVSEENASGGEIVVAPTCGSSGVIPGCITYLRMLNYSKADIIDGLLVAGLIGNLAKTNASISGAEAGCQAEIGVACAMSAAMVSYVTTKNNDSVAQCAESALEHSLGLTCDPVEGYVQIPCIERCAVFALKAISVVVLSRMIPSSTNKLTFDQTLKTMLETGRDLKAEYRETSISGLAKLFN